MKIRSFLAVALAAGGFAFAAQAAPSQTASPKTLAEFLNSKKTSAAPVAATAKPGKPAIVKKAGRQPTKATAAKPRHKATAAVSSKRLKAKLVSTKRQRVIIDTKTNALISPADLAKTVPTELKIASAASAYNPIITRYAAEYDIPASLAHAVISVESNYRPTVLGSAGEIGLMQIKPDTARMLGYSGSTRGLYDPETNIRFGMKYLAMAHDLGGGDICGTILRYNAGHAATRMNPVSAAYCAKVKTRLGS